MNKKLTLNYLLVTPISNRCGSFRTTHLGHFINLRWEPLPLPPSSGLGVGTLPSA